MPKHAAAVCPKQCKCGSSRRPRRKSTYAKPRLEALEARLLMTVGPSPAEWNASLGYGFVCGCPICTGQGLEAIPVTMEVAGGPALSNPISSLPQLHSNPVATAKLFLDFNGHFESSWGGRSNVTTPVFDRDGNLSTFSDGELATIQEIWARVAEDFAPFNIDVTTVDPGHQTNQVVAVISIGGNGAWYGSAGGVAYIGGFYNGASNVGYVFEDNLGNGNPKYVAEAASHEAGHLFGLLHQATWNGSTLTEPYSSGNNGWAPIMGVGYYEARTTWHNGPRDSGPTAYQDDLAILSNASNGFGLRADDYGNTLQTAAVLPVSGTSVNFSGLIGWPSDVDVWSFSTTGGTINVQLTGAAFSPNLDAVLQLWDTQAVITTASPTNSLGASLSLTVGAGTYYLVARGMGDYGDMGQYTITGSIPPAVPAPEIGLSVNGSALASGGTLSFGTTAPGVAATRTVTVTNQGTQALTLTPLDPAALSPGFTLVQNLGATTLNPGQTTTFVVQLDAAAAGSFNCQLALSSNDADESPFTLQLAGTVAVPAAVTIIDDGNAGNTLAGAWKLKTGTGYGNDMRQAAKGNGSTSATWTFNSLPMAQYRVWVTYRIGSTNATNAPFTLYNGNTTVRTVRVNERLTPASLEANGARWQSLGNVWITNGRLVVKLTNAANGQVVADAVRIERIVSSGSLAATLASSSTVATTFEATGSNATTSTSPAVASRPVLPTSAPRSLDTAYHPGDYAAEAGVLRSVVDLLRVSRQAREQQSAVDQLAADESAWSELLTPLI